MEDYVQVEMSQEDLAAFRKFKEDQEKEKIYKDKMNDYRVLVDKTVRFAYEDLSEISTKMKNLKQRLIDDFSTLIEMKSEIFEVNSGQKSHSFINSDGDIKVTFGYHFKDNYQDTVNEGIELIRESISELGTDENSRLLVDAVMTLISKDKYGGINAQKLLQLRKLSNRIQNEKFTKGVKVIEDSYEITKTKSYIYLEVKGTSGKWNRIPLSLTDV